MIECPICFSPYDLESRKPIRTFCKCHQTLCRECLEKLLMHFTNCPWDRSRWSGRNLMKKFEDSTPVDYFATLEAAARNGSNDSLNDIEDLCSSSSSSSTSSSPERQGSPAKDDEWDVSRQEQLFREIEMMKKDRDMAIALSKGEDFPPPSSTASDTKKKPKLDLLRFFIQELDRRPQDSVALFLSPPRSLSKPTLINDAEKTMEATAIKPAPSSSLGVSRKDSSRSREAGTVDILSAWNTKRRKASTSHWICTHCSFRNFPLLPACEMCDTKRPLGSEDAVVVEIE